MQAVTRQRKIMLCQIYRSMIECTPKTIGHKGAVVLDLLYTQHHTTFFACIEIVIIKNATNNHCCREKMKSESFYGTHFVMTRKCIIMPQWLDSNTNLVLSK